MSYEFEVAVPDRPPEPRRLRNAVGLPDLRGFPDADGDAGAPQPWPEDGLMLHREGLSTRTTVVTWAEGRLKVVLRALAAPEDGELALRLVEGAAALAGAPAVEAAYYGSVDLPDLRRLHPADWMDEQVESGARALATLIRDGKGPIALPGPLRPCWIGERLLGELDEGAGPPEALPARVLATLRRVQWGVPAGFRNAGVFISGGAEQRERETRFAVWLPGERLVLPRVDYVALRVAAGEIVMVPFAAVAALAGPHAAPLDEEQLLLRPVGAGDWAAIVARARPLAVSAPRR